MSGGGGERKRCGGARGLGWEEAGGEFYQECYPGAELDLEALPRDPHYFATLLPSKQTRAATNKRQRAEPRSTFKRRTSTRSRNYNTMGGHNTVQTDIHVAMMPDLSENLANEESTWEEIMLIKALPVGMSQKKDMKAKLLSAATFRLQGMKQFKWQHRKLWEYLKMRWKELSKKVELWRDCMRTIEGNFGTGVVTYFAFIKWLMFLNILLSLIMVSFIVAPTLLFREPGVETCSSHGNDTFSVDCCSQIYSNNWTNLSLSVFDVLQATGPLEPTVVFYAVYPNSVLEGSLFYYNLPIAYIVTVLVFLFVSLFAIIKRGASGFREKLVENEGQYYKYCNMIFGGWDFCIYNDKSAGIKHRALYFEMKESLDAEKWEEEKKNRSRDEVCRLIFTRIFVNIVISIIFLGTACATFLVHRYCFMELLREDYYDEVLRLVLEYAPYLCIVSLNTLVPPLFNYLIHFEHYSPQFAWGLSLFRAILLRLSSFTALLVRLYLIVGCKVEEGSCFSTSCHTPACWELYLGQQLYKLLVLDVLFHVLLTFFLNLPRMLLAKHIKCRLARKLGTQEFELGKHLLDVIYIQVLVWFGTFYIPLLPALAAFIFYFLFYIKKFACLVNSRPSTRVYRASKCKSLFMSLLLMGFFVGVVPWAYAISEIEPSKSCGPFRGQISVWSVVEESYFGLPLWLRNAVDYLYTTSFLLPTFLMLFLTLYYYYVVSELNKRMVSVLKKQLVLEGHDKQFLLNRLSAFIKQHQERYKPARSVEPTTAAST